MTTEQRERAEELFTLLVDLPRADRTRFLDEHCRDDAIVRVEVETLLAHDGEGDFLDSGGFALRAADLIGGAGATREAMPERIAHYRILRRVGQGGTAVVYEAEQDNPRRTVAVKVVRGSPALNRRFRREIQLLGQLTHPGIARIYDAGVATTAEGEVSYFAMEFVRGDALTDFADRHGLGVRDRLSLVAHICDAVQVAHEQGIIHRDLKPGNILMDGGAADARPKVLDFGVARAMSADTQITIEHTNVVQFIGTIPYMSPEQVRGKGSDLDPRTDVYSLGVVTYELLCGRLPLDVRDRSIAEAARIIQEVDPTPLSSINTILRGDVETIVARALDKDRTRRYETVAAFAADLRRYLQDEPIHARPASTFYQFRKFAKRNRALVSAVALMFLSLVAATLVSTRFAMQASREKALAERRAHRARIVAAGAEIASSNPIHARELLEQASAHERTTWEWRYLMAQLERSDRILEGHQARVNALAFSPDGSRLASASDDQTVHVWNLAGRTEPMILQGHAAAVRRVLFDPRGTMILSGGADHTIGVWDPGTGAFAGALPTEGTLDDLAIAPNGDGLAALVTLDSLSYNRTRQRRLESWELPTRTLRFSQALSQGVPTASCGYSADGEKILLGVQRGIEERSANTGARLAMHPSVHDSPPLAIAGDASCTILVTSGADKNVVVWDATDFRTLHVMQGHTGPVRCAALDPTGVRLATGADDETVRLWNTQTGELDRCLIGHAGVVRAVAFSPDGTSLASASDDKTVRLWNLEQIDSRRSDGVLRGHAGAVWDVAFLPGTDDFVSVSWGDRTLRHWDAATGDAVQVHRDMQPQIQQLACSPDGTRIAIAGWALDLIDAETGAASRLERLYKPARSVAFSLDGARVAVTVDRGPRKSAGTVQAWDVQSARLIVNRDLDGQALVASSPRGMRVAVFGEDHSELLDPLTGEVLLRFGRQDSRVERVRFAADGTRFTTACQDGSVGVWDARTGAPLALLRGHREIAYDAVFSPDGRRIATCSNDNSIRIWDTDTFDEILVLRGHERYVYALAFSADGATLASASGDGTVRLWRTR